MNCSAKIDLENAIFSRAARLGLCVYARAGELLCPSSDEKLRQMLGVYNRFFAEENRRAAGEEYPPHIWGSYRRETAVLGYLHAVVYPPDLEMEIRWLENMAPKGGGQRVDPFLFFLIR